MYTTIPELLAAMRLEAGDITQGEVCRRTGVGQSTLSRYESGLRVPTIGILQKIARGLGCQVLLATKWPEKK